MFEKKSKELPKEKIVPLPPNEDLNELSRLKLQKFILESERITKEAKELNNQLTLKIPVSSNYTNSNGSIDCTIKFDITTGTPYLQLYKFKEFGSGSYIDFQLNDLRLLIEWLKDRGIE